METATHIALAGQRAIPLGVTSGWVQGRLERAGATLLAMRLPKTGPSGLKGYWPDLVRDSFIDMPSDSEGRAGVPDARAVSAMDEALEWVLLIPEHLPKVRRAVHLRLLLDPVTEKHRFNYSKIARILHCSPNTAQSWHEKGLGFITRGLRLNPTLMQVNNATLKTY